MTSKRNDPAEMTAGQEFSSTRILSAPRELVFRAWADPKHVARWWGPHGFTNPVCELDVRPGGRIRIHMRGPEGTVHPMTGIYREVVEPTMLVFTSSALDKEGNPLFEVLNTVTFAEQGGKTIQALKARVIRASAAAAPLLAGMEAGWTQSLERLEAHVTGGSKGKGPMAAKVEAPDDAADREIVISRVFDATRELAWEAWTNPKHVVNWWGPRGFTTTILEMDVRPGGAWRHIMHGPDGADYPNECVFTEVVKPEHIAFSNRGGKAGGPAAQFQARWTFEAQGDKTRITIRMIFPSAAARDWVVKEHGAIEGGKQTLERLAEYLAKGIDR